MTDNKFNEYVTYLRKTLSIGQSFDIAERNIIIGDKEAYFYFVEGFIKGEVMERILSEFLNTTSIEMEKCHNAMDFMKTQIPYAQAKTEKDLDNMVKAVLSGLTVLIVDGYAEAIAMDLRTYPVRSVDEPEKEKSLRGPKDGLVETLLFNTAMIRRRIRDPKLVFEMHTVGTTSKTDVCVVYIKDVADDKLIEKVVSKIKDINLDSTTVGDQSIVEAIGKSQWLNPFPKVRYTQRPDIVSAHLTEGKIVILTDNSPTAIMIPTSIFDFLQDTDDYYFPIMTGNYFRFMRTANMLVVIFLTPIYLLIAEDYITIPQRLEFFMPDEGYSMPLFWQFILLEFAIDGLKLASLNTPSSMGMSLSVIGALILGQFAIDSGWFIPQTILCMAILALAAFTQPGIELGYALKYMRVLLLIGAIIFGVWGAIIALIIGLIILATTKNIVGTPYLYPLFPLEWKKLRKLLFKTRK